MVIGIRIFAINVLTVVSEESVLGSAISTMEMAMSFSGGGFLGLYYMGVIVCLQRYASHVKLTRVGGTSAGALAATCLVCGKPAEEFIGPMLELVKKIRSRTIGVLGPTFNLNLELKKSLRETLPEDAHVQANGKLVVSITRAIDGRNELVSEFESRDDLIDCLCASSFVPIFSGLVPPKFRGKRYMDGMFTDNTPILTDDVIKVTPFSGEFDICPSYAHNPNLHLNFANTSIALTRINVVKLFKLLLPPSHEVMVQQCRNGFLDAMHFLTQNNYILCANCLVRKKDQNEICDECELLKRNSSAHDLPEDVLSLLNDIKPKRNDEKHNFLAVVEFITVAILPLVILLECVLTFIFFIVGLSLLLFRKIIGPLPSGMNKKTR